MELINLTPHVLTLIRTDGNEITFDLCNEPARVEEELEGVGLTGPLEEMHGKVRLQHRTFGRVSFLPEPEKGVMFIVSALVAAAAWDLGRHDVVSPGMLVRDEGGKVIGAESLICSPDFRGWSPIITYRSKSEQEVMRDKKPRRDEGPNEPGFHGRY